MLMDIGITITAFGAMLAGFYSIARLMLNQATKDREAERKERKELSSAIRLMARNSKKVASATTRTADEAKARNGHLAELVVQSSKNAESMAKKATATVIEAMQNVSEQHVDHMNIDKATIKKAK